MSSVKMPMRPPGSPGATARPGPSWRHRSRPSTPPCASGWERRGTGGTMADVTTPAPPRTPTGGTVVMDANGRIRIPRGGAITIAFMRNRGPVDLWAFIAQGFGITDTNKAMPPPDAPAGAKVTYEWTFGCDADVGWISSGFDHSPTDSYVDNNLHGTG